MGPKNQTSSTPPLCIDCRFCSRWTISRILRLPVSDFLTCSHPLLTQDVVKGKDTAYCSTQRISSGRCRREGIYFEHYNKKERKIIQVIKKLDRE